MVPHGIPEAIFLPDALFADQRDRETLRWCLSLLARADQVAQSSWTETA
jgi:hypothetical protein